MDVSTAEESDHVQDVVLQARLCHLIRWSDYKGFGFNLIARKSRSGHYVGDVDIGGPAFMGGLKEDDRIIEVNGVNILNKSHEDVVRNIMQSKDDVQLLVIDDLTYNWWKSHGVNPTFDHKYAIYIRAPREKPYTASRRTLTENTQLGFLQQPMEQEQPTRAVCRYFTLPSPISTKTTDVNFEKFKMSLLNERLETVEVIESPLIRRRLNATRSSESIESGVFMASLDNLQLSPTKPRVCHLVKSATGNGYGFKLNTPRNSSGHFIKEIDCEGPAYDSDLKAGDRVIEVNGVNVEKLKHVQVTNMIRNSENGEVRLTVSDDDSYKRWGHQNLDASTGSMSNSSAGQSTPSQRLQEMNTRISSAGACLLGSSDSYASTTEPVQITESALSESEQKATLSCAKHKRQSRHSRQATVGSSTAMAQQVLVSNEAVRTSSSEILPDSTRAKPHLNESEMYSESGLANVTVEMSVTEDIIEKSHAEAPVAEVKKKHVSSKFGPAPRLCRVVRVDNYVGYGFALRTYKASKEKFIVEVKANSPAAKAGLREHDRAIEINGMNIDADTHAQACARVLSVKGEVELFVLEQSEYAWYVKRRTMPKSTQENVIMLTNVDRDKNGPTASREDTNLNRALSLSSNELRQMISSRKKPDPRMTGCQFERTVEVFESL